MSSRVKSLTKLIRSKLFHILGNVIYDLYSWNVGSSARPTTGELLTRVIKSEEKLNRWERQLPPSLEMVSVSSVFNSGTSSTPLWTRAQIILTLRWLSARLMVYRAVSDECLARIADGLNPLEPESFPEICKTYLRLCSKLSREVIDLICHPIITQRMLSSWWYSLYYRSSRPFRAVCS